MSEDLVRAHTCIHIKSNTLPCAVPYLMVGNVSHDQDADDKGAGNFTDTLVSGRLDEDL